MSGPDPAFDPAFRLRKTLGGFPAECALSFAIDKGLSKINCKLDEFHDVQTHIAAEKKFLASLHKKYGRSSDVINNEDSDDNIIFEQKNNSDWVWQNDQAKLLFHSQYDDLSPPGLSNSMMFTSKMSLSLSSAQHQKLANKLKAKQDALLEQKRAKERQKEEEQRRHAQKILDEAKAKLDDDL